VSLLSLISRERSRRSAPTSEAQVIIWRDSNEQAAANVEAATRAGRIGPQTEIIRVGWRPPIDSIEASP
jgi:hypothetical protein